MKMKNEQVSSRDSGKSWRVGMSLSFESGRIIGENRILLERLPQPDYRTHPAYGGAFPAPRLGLRVKALSRLVPWFCLVIAKQLLLFDRLPAPSEYTGYIGGGMLGRMMAIPRYLPLIGRGLVDQFWHTLRGRRRLLTTAMGGLGEVFRRDGIVVTRITDEEMRDIKAQIAEPLAELLARRDRTGGRSFESNQLWLNVRNASDLYATLDRVLSHHGILAGARAYLGRPVRIKHILLQVNDARDSFQYDKFSDVGLTDPATNYMHIDTSYDMVKCVIYLNEVGERNGPFCYVPGSARVRVGVFEGLVRRAVDRSGLSGYARPTRELFMALPASLRMKCTFGSDLLDGSAEAKSLLAGEYRFTSADGNLAMFDNLGIHRGALVLEGDRRVLFITLA